VEPTLQKAVSLAPDDWSLMQQLGEYYLDKGRWAQAGEQYRRAVELMPDNPRPHNNLGLVYEGLGRLEESAAAFQRAIDLEPTFIRFRNLGMVLAEAGKYEEASRMLERSIEMRPDNYRAWGLLATVHLNQHADPAKVRETFRKAIALTADLRKETPTDAYLLADVGGYYAAMEMEKESLPLLCRRQPSRRYPQVLYQVAIGYEALHRREEALRWLARAKAGGYPSELIVRNPSWPPSRRSTLRRDRRRSSGNCQHAGGDSMGNPMSIAPRPAQEEEGEEEVGDEEEAISSAFAVAPGRPRGHRLLALSQLPAP
jgi:Tfp pilus assembly protein PilF